MPTIKQEIVQNSDNDTDDASDDENESCPIFSVKTEPGLKCPPNTNDEIHQQQQQPTVSQTCEEKMNMGTVNLKEELQDDPIESDQETDDEQNASFGDQYEEAVPNAARPEKVQKINGYQQPSTSTHNDSTTKELNHCNSHDQANSSSGGGGHQSKQFNVIGSRSSQSANTEHGKPLLRFNNFTQSPVHSLDDEKDDENDDYEMTDLYDEISNLIKHKQQEYEKEAAQLSNVEVFYK